MLGIPVEAPIQFSATCYHQDMLRDEAAIFARLATANADLRQAIANLDDAVAGCQESRRELVELLGVIERVQRGDDEALSDVSPPL